MSKKASKQAKSTPDIYKDLPAARTNICVMEDHDGNISLHNSLAALEKLKSFNSLIKDSIRKIWENFDAFCKENEQTILAYHSNEFGAEPPKSQDLIITAVQTWNSMVDSAKSDLTTAEPTSSTGRKSTILSCTYMLGTTVEGDGPLKTPQAKACLTIFRDAIKRQQDHDTAQAEATSIPLPKEYEPKITEEVLRKAIEDRAGELHTRQDPWRIFQYYRKDLIEGKLLRRS